MAFLDILRNKRDGGILESGEIREAIAAYTRGEAADYQMSALLMAIFLNGMNDAETQALTEAMLHSGDVLDFSDVPGPKVDKHSTGGVGDKTSLILAPIVAAAGGRIPMISGRGLGHTGGTLDKLEAIPGFRVGLSTEEIRAALTGPGFCIAGQTERIAPADKRIYALRDVTCTVDCIPLIVASIMSKKLAEGIDGLVLDVKVGRGAFMKTEEDARTLGRAMADTGRLMGKRVTVLLTAMDQPLGREAGNANEVAESIQVLRGEGPEDLTGLSIELAAEMLLLAGLSSDLPAARTLARAQIDSGAALQRFAQAVAFQGGDPRVVEDLSLLPKPRHTHTLRATGRGFVTALDAEKIGRAVVALGGGRLRKEDDVDPAVGITLLAKVSDPLEAGTPMAEVGYSDATRLEGALELLGTAWETGPAAPVVEPLIRERIG